jgi:hypothetical protein
MEVQGKNENDINRTVTQEDLNKAQQLLQPTAPAMPAIPAIPKITLLDVLQKTSGLSKEQLDAISNTDATVIQETVIQTLKENFWGILAALATIIPGIGAEILGVFKIGDKLKDLQKKIADKILEKMPQVPRMPEINHQYGGKKYAKKTESILKRIERSKSLFRKTNRKTRKQNKTKRRAKNLRKQIRE